ncbi:MAG: TonB-dependent receptor plug domain-containing protein [Flavobacteriaceae bacterium]|nr:TonB-dependent receptor plug domain-containing protein [Flavobacteriaceae bacterium]
MNHLKIVLIIIFICGFSDLYSQDKTSDGANPAEATLLWDVSQSMSNRNIQAELTYLNDYFSKFRQGNVTLIKFNYRETFRKTYQIANSDWEEISQELIHSIYDGATSFGWMKQENFSGPTLVFSDAGETWQASGLPKNTNLIWVNLTEKPKNITENSVVEYKGFVYSEKGPVEGVSIRLKDTERGVATDSSGFYRIAAKKGDILVFSHVGSQEKAIRLADDTQVDLLLEKGTISLKEVTVTEKKRNEETVTTGYGQENKEKIGYAVTTIKADDISAVETNISSALAGKVAGMNAAVDNGPDMSRVVIRGIKSINLSSSPLIVIDGVPQQRTNEGSFTFGVAETITDTRHLDPANIAEITVLRGLAATNRYGSEGGNGVILITTKTNSFNNPNGQSKKSKKKAPEFVEYEAETPFYLSDLQVLESEEIRYEKYLTYRELFGNSTDFYINVYKVFKAKNSTLAFDILSNVAELFGDNLSALNAMAYVLEEANDYESALKVYEKIKEIHPDQSQSLLNIANIQYLNKNYKEAFNRYLSIRNNKTWDSYALKKQLMNSLNSSVSKDKALYNDGNTPGFTKNGVSVPIRIVLEWSQYDTAFELQFVDPANNYINIGYTKDSEQYIENMKNNYYTIESVIEEGSPKGLWLANLKLLEETSTPVYFKIQIFKNFGTPDETFETKVVTISQPNVNFNFLKLVF